MTSVSTTLSRVEKIQEKLTRALSPSYLKIIDDSGDHAGHLDPEDTAGHYTLIIKSNCFSGLSPVKQHQMIYEILGNMIGPEIHALRIQASV